MIIHNVRPIKSFKEKLSLITDQIKQYRETKEYFSHYFFNILRILEGIPIIDYKKISHKNLMVDHYR